MLADENGKGRAVVAINRKDIAYVMVLDKQGKFHSLSVEGNGLTSGINKNATKP